MKQYKDTLCHIETEFSNHGAYHDSLGRGFVKYSPNRLVEVWVKVSNEWKNSHKLVGKFKTLEQGLAELEKALK